MLKYLLTHHEPSNSQGDQAAEWALGHDSYKHSQEAPFLKLNLSPGAWAQRLVTAKEKPCSTWMSFYCSDVQSWNSSRPTFIFLFATNQVFGYVSQWLLMFASCAAMHANRKHFFVDTHYFVKNTVYVVELSSQNTVGSAVGQINKSSLRGRHWTVNHRTV